jgi:hypothetical protein
MLVVGIVAALVFGVVQPFDGGSASATHGGTGNGAPNGSHYNLNIVGVPKDKTADMKGAKGHVIFVKLEGKSKIWLCESGVDAGCDDVSGFQVIDANGTDSDGALFALPNPDPDGDGTTVYSVFARALGQPGGSSMTTTCATDPSDGTEVCSVITLELERDKGRSKFDNVSKYLLYIYADIDGDGDLERVSLFDSSLEGYFWDYDNNGLRLAQLRFYECETIVPEADDPGGSQDDVDCFGGSH